MRSACSGLTLLTGDETPAPPGRNFAAADPIDAPFRADAAAILAECA